MKEFDLNIEKVLENWEPYHAVREIIANALDEQILTNTKPIKIYKDNSGAWHIRDYGRGLKIQHFTQNESTEKLSHPGIIGKFGVGLKDALATFDRHNISVKIISKHGEYTTGHAKKHGFEDITTLHAYANPPQDINFSGTDFIFSNLDDQTVETAKQFFLIFSNLRRLDQTQYGEIYARRNHTGEIFINGIKVATEENFLFSYNITSLTKPLQKALNRERTNVGRSAYADRIKSILLMSTAPEIVDTFTNNLSELNSGTQCDEIKWTDVQFHFAELLSQSDDVIFATPEQIHEASGQTNEIIEESGKRVVFVPQNIQEKLEQSTDKNHSINTIATIMDDYNKSFEYKFIEVKDLTSHEKSNFSFAQSVIDLVHPSFPLDSVYISETLRPDVSSDTIRGICENGRTIILREVLKDRTEFLGVLAHELTHAKGKHSDYTRDFENDLTDCIGKLLARLLP